MNNKLSQKYFQQGAEFLGVKYPIISGAMAWVSDPALVAAVSNNGGFGCLAGGNTPAKILEEQIIETRKLTPNPFAVNLITISPNYHEQLYLAQWMKLPYVIFAGSFPKKNEVKIIKESGAKVICFASTRSIADRMIRYGADALILEGSEAGGHVGRVTLTVLLQQVLFNTTEVPVFVAGGIATGKMAAHLLLMGAAGIQMGTRFAISNESNIHPETKKAYIRAHSRNAVSTPQFDSRLQIVPVRGIRNKALDDFKNLQLELIKQLDDGKISHADAQIQAEKFWHGALRRAVQDGDVDMGSLMAGQSVGMIEEELPVKTIIDNMVTDIEQELQKVKASLG